MDDKTDEFDYDADFSARFPDLVLDEEEQEIEDCPEMGEPVTGERLERILAIVRQDKIEREAAKKERGQRLPTSVRDAERIV